jgi:hypothetical protein
MIIWIASYPKSGNTWVRAFINKIFLKEKFDLNNLGKIVEQFPKKSQYLNIINDFNNIDQILKNSVKAQKKILEKNKVKFLKTHSMYYKLQNGDIFTNDHTTLGAIYLIRDPRNVFLSFQNHSSANEEEMEKIFFSELRWFGHVFKGDEDENKDYSIKTLIGNWRNNYISWKRSVKNLLIIKYEDLIDNPDKEFKRITNYLRKYVKINISEDEINNIIEEISFDNLKKLEEKNGFFESPIDKNNQKKNFFSLGSKRNWSDTLDKRITKKIEKNFYKEMKELDYI